MGNLGYFFKGVIFGMEEYNGCLVVGKVFGELVGCVCWEFGEIEFVFWVYGDIEGVLLVL